MNNILVSVFLVILLTPAVMAAPQRGPSPAAPPDVKPSSINSEDVAYPYPTSSLPITLYGQELRMSYMDVPPQGQPNGQRIEASGARGIQRLHQRRHSRFGRKARNLSWNAGHRSTFTH